MKGRRVYTFVKAGLLLSKTQSALIPVFKPRGLSTIDCLSAVKTSVLGGFFDVVYSSEKQVPQGKYAGKSTLPWYQKVFYDYENVLNSVQNQPLEEVNVLLKELEQRKKEWKPDMMMDYNRRRNSFIGTARTKYKFGVSGILDQNAEGILCKQTARLFSYPDFIICNTNVYTLRLSML